VASAGVVHASRLAIADGSDVTRPTVALGARLGRQIALGGWRVRPYAQMDVPLLRWRLMTADRVSLRQGWLSGSVGLELLTALR
jgi:hypothetical protein